jgi:uncharacterized protein (TIGR00251 family)
VRAIEDGTKVEVFVQPRAAKDAIVGIHGSALKIKVKAPPLDDRANRAVEEVIARALGVPRSRVSVVGGAKSRSKQIAVRGVGVAAVKKAIIHVLSSRAHEPGQEALIGPKERPEGEEEDAEEGHIQEDRREEERG